MKNLDLVVTEVKKNEKYEVTFGKTPMEVVILTQEGKSTPSLILTICGSEKKKEQLFESAKDLRKYLSQYTGFHEAVFKHIHGPVRFT